MLGYIDKYGENKWDQIQNMPFPANMLPLIDGWVYWYIHIKRFVRKQTGGKG